MGFRRPLENADKLCRWSRGGRERMNRSVGAWGRRLGGFANLEGRVALTIDAEFPSRPASPDNASRMLDALAREHALATFFVQGQWASAYPELTLRIVAEGHMLGSHSQWHAPLTALTDEGIRDSVKSTEAALVDACGCSPRPWFRCPYGTGMNDPRVLGVLGELGYRSIGWDVAASDWLPGQSVDEVIESVMNGCRAHGDGVRVLLHSWPDVTLTAVPVLLDRLRRGGARLVRVDEIWTSDAATREPQTTPPT